MRIEFGKTDIFVRERLETIQRFANVKVAFFYLLQQVAEIVFIHRWFLSAPRSSCRSEIPADQ